MPRNVFQMGYFRAVPRWRFPLVAAIIAIAGALVLIPAPPAAAQSPTTLTLTVPKDTVHEDAGAVTVTATLDQPAAAGGVRVTLTSRPLTSRAQVGYDFSLPPAFTIAENQTSGTADVTILDNQLVERDKPLVLSATVDVTGITVRGVTFTLVDDDLPYLTGLYVHPSGDIDVDDDPNAVRRLVMTPNFSESPLALNYATRVNPDIPSVTVRATGAQPGIVKIGLQGSTLAQAPVSSRNHAVSQAIPLVDGGNVIEVQRTLYGKSSTYTVTVTRGLLPGPDFSANRDARNGLPALTVTLAERPLSGQEMRIQLRESTTDDWPDAAGSNLLPEGASSGPFSSTSRNILVTGLSKDTAYEVRAHLVELTGSITEPDVTVISESSAEVQVAAMNPAPAPTGLTLTPTPPGQGFSRAISASWDAVSDGSPRIRYHLRWRKTGQTPEAAWSNFGPFLATTQWTSTLPDDGTYDVQVASDNGIDPIAWSASGQATVNHAGGV